MNPHNHHRSTPRTARQWTRQTIIGLALTLTAPAAYMLAFDQPWLRRNGLLLWSMMSAGVIVAVHAALRSRKRWTVISAALCTALLGLSLYGFYGWAALPADARFGTLTTAPDFTLPDQDHRNVALSDLRSTSRVLLIFTRGYW